MRAKIIDDGVSNGVRIDEIKSGEQVTKLVGLALKLGLPDVSVGAPDGNYTVDIRFPPGEHAAGPLAAMLQIVTEIQRTTPEKLIAWWRKEVRYVPEPGAWR